MSTKTNAEMLKSFKQYNKEAREKKAKKEGFVDAATMLSYIQGFIDKGKGNSAYVPLKASVPSKEPAKAKPTAKQVKATVTGASRKRVTIHVVDVLDSSGSMSGGKYSAATKGINIGIENLRTDKVEVDYTYTMCDFSDDIIFRYDVAPLKDVDKFNGHTRGSTALYDAIGDSISKVQKAKGSEDKVLVNIYTDGQENSSRRYRADHIANLIEELSSQGWTFTFIGTAGDVAYAQRNLKFHESNTLVHDNTEKGIARGMSVNSSARAAYSSKVSRGEDVSTGFYKDIE